MLKVLFIIVTTLFLTACDGGSGSTDTVKPVIMIKGDKSVIVNVGDKYTDAGATATDDVDGNLTDKIQVTSDVNISQEGNYTVTYNVSDRAGNAADTVTRHVMVKKKEVEPGAYQWKRYPEDETKLADDSYVVYYPKDHITPDMPVVLFLEGGGADVHIDFPKKPNDVYYYRGIMKYLASKGYFVIGGETGDGYDIRNAVHIFDDAMALGKEAHGLSYKKLVVMGHSQGGGDAFYTMKHLQDKGYGSEGSLVLSVDGWFSFDMNKSDLGALKGNVAFFQMNGLEGTGTDPRIPLSIWNLASQTDRKFLIEPDTTKDDHAYIAGDYKDILERKSLTGVIGALCEDTFNGDTSGYDAIDAKYKAEYEEIKGALKPKDDEFYVGDCAGIRYGAKDELENFDIDYCALGAKAEIVDRTVDNGLPNLAKDTNPNFNTLVKYETADKHRYIENDSHTADGSGSVELLAHHWKNALYSQTFPVKKGKKYLLSGYVKMTKVPHGQNVTISLWPRSVTGWSEISWNVSKAGEWQEILMPFIPVADGDAKWAAFTTTRAFSTEYAVTRRKYGIDIYKPSAVKEDGSNLDRSSRVFFDDFKVVEMQEEITPREPVNIDKKTFKSDFIRVDKLGNMSVKKEGKWIPIIPKLISRGKNIKDEHLKKQLRAYKKHGFNGVMGMYDVDQVKKAFDAGLEYFVGMGASSNTQPDGTEGEYSSIVSGEAKRFKEEIRYINAQGKPYAQLFHYLDNENEKTQEYTFKEKWAKFIDENDKDANGHRARPIFYLNGTFGISRLYSKKLMDMTGAYVGMGGTGSPHAGAPKPTIGVMDVTQGHDVPSNVIQLQTYLDDKFIPSLWFGIIQGGKVISVWKDGEGDGSDNNEPKPFQEYAWATDIKKVFAEVDSMAAIIREPHWTKWKVHFEGSEYVNLGTREHNGEAYVILSNHSDSDESVTLSFEDIAPTAVKDYLGDKGTFDVVDNKVTVTIGHGNKGYLVLKCVQ